LLWNLRAVLQNPRHSPIDDVYELKETVGTMDQQSREILSSKKLALAAEDEALNRRWMRERI